MITKEEDKELLEEFAETLPHLQYGVLMERDWETSKKCVLIAKEYADIKAKEKAIEFAEWINYNGYRICDKVFNTWKNDYDVEIEYTNEELYNLFIEQSKINTNDTNNSD